MGERVIVLRDVPTGPGFADEDMPVAGMEGMTKHAPGTMRRTGTGVACRAEPVLQPTLNRQARARIGIRPGERQFFRVVNASAARYYDLSVDDATLDLIARDGVPLDAYPRTPPVDRVGHVLLPPGARAEFVVTAPGHPTVLRSACVDSGRGGDADPPVVLADLLDPATLFGGAPSRPLDVHARPLTIGSPLPRNLLSRPFAKPVVRRIVHFTEDARGFYIDGRAFRMGEPPTIVARSGTVEEWTIVNSTDELHDFHIHQIHFVTESIDGVPVPRRTWADTVNVPSQHHGKGGTTPGRVRLLMDFRDPVVRGTFVYHCHILDHEDKGMMATIRVM
jgi:FtsP/CotA-like multicopper oxidase with cupredoxin domain